jgi:tRNA (cytidine/uridine-2'-O-)-methyltransferase
MALHLALLEPTTPTNVGALARHCADVDTPLHLVGPLPFPGDDAKFVSAGPKRLDSLDWWVHAGWRDFREAMSRERCIYFAIDAERETAEAPFRPNSVLVIGNEEGGLPDRIREKYPHRIFRLPMPPRKRKVDVAESAKLLLEIAAAGPRDSRDAMVVKPTGPMRYGRGRRRR